MKKYLLRRDGQFYKVNLHCHSTVSDGHYTPEEIKELYKAQGYSAVAFTEHNIMISHTDLNDDGFVALHGFEAEFNEPYGEGTDKNFYDIKTAHLCFIALDPDNLVHPFWHRTKYQDNGNVSKYVPMAQFREDEPDFERSHTPECVNHAIKLGRERGFFVSYNHPTWSLESYPDYIAYENMNAMEIYNTTSHWQGYDEYAPRVYDDMLRAGKRIVCTATDDNHNHNHAPLPDSFGGFTMVKAERLDYKSIMSALCEGQCYASSGPLIDELTYENGKIFVKCSDARYIDFSTDRRHSLRVYNKDGSAVSEGAFELDSKDKYVRVTITDFEGNHANSRAYFVDELEEDK